jgi:hypothetical protein
MLCGTGVFAGRGGHDGSGEKGKASKWEWLIWLGVFLFPIPFSPWWLSLICMAAFGSLLFLVYRQRR